MKRVLAHVLAFAIAMIVAARPALADEASARASFKQAEDLRKAGKWAEACPLYEASFRDDPQLGVLLHLADCHERTGKLASAWGEFNDAADVAHKRGDPREADARKEADLLAPRLAKLHVVPPPQIYQGLIVKRDGSDITILVGTDMPIDPGKHTITASAPGFVDWSGDVTITGEGTLAQLAIPALGKVPEKPIETPPPVVHEGTLTIDAPDGAKIVLDSYDVGVGHYTAKVKSGGHTLRVTAPGMRMYQGEVVVSDGEERKVDIVLDKEPPPTTTIVAAAPVEAPSPSGEVGVGFAPGQKRFGDDPTEIAYRVDVGFYVGRHVNLGGYLEYGSIDASGNCGTALPGRTPSSPYDYGMRFQFTKCRYYLAGVQIVVHVLPRQTVDPYVAFLPGFRFGLDDYTPYSASGIAQATHTGELFPGIVAGGRVGVDYHFTPDGGWTVGSFFETQVTVLGNEVGDKDKSGYDVPSQPFVSLLGGVRGGYAW